MELDSLLCGALNGKEIRKVGMCVYVELIHFALQQKRTQHYKAARIQLFKK